MTFLTGCTKKQHLTTTTQFQTFINNKEQQQQQPPSTPLLSSQNPTTKYNQTYIITSDQHKYENAEKDNPPPYCSTPLLSSHHQLKPSTLQDDPILLSSQPEQEEIIIPDEPLINPSTIQPIPQQSTLTVIKSHVAITSTKTSNKKLSTNLIKKHPEIKMRQLIGDIMDYSLDAIQKIPDHENLKHDIYLLIQTLNNVLALLPPQKNNTIDAKQIVLDIYQIIYPESDSACLNCSARRGDLIDYLIKSKQVNKISSVDQFVSFLKEL
jgi:hypothetical protein